MAENPSGPVLELGLLSRTTITEDMSEIIEARVSARLFFEPLYANAFIYALEHFGAYRHPPTLRVFEAEFPGLAARIEKAAADLDEPTGWLIAKLRKHYATNRLQKMITDAATDSHRDPVGALEALWQAADEARRVAPLPNGGAPRLWKATDLHPAQQPRWLAKGRLPRGAVSLLVGDEGIGKSLLWVWVVARITTGGGEFLFPEFGIPRRDPEHVLIAAITEDDCQTVVRPRLEVAGADLNMIQVIRTDPDGSGAPTCPSERSRTCWPTVV
jgi:hypothetical protein